MNQRFISNLALAVAGATVVVSTQSFSAGTAGWIMFGVSLGTLALLIVVQRNREGGLVQAVLDVTIGVLAVWSAVASVVYAGSTLTWLTFAEACGLVALALAGLVAHEVATERLVRAPVEGRGGERAEELQVAA